MGLDGCGANATVLMLVVVWAGADWQRDGMKDGLEEKREERKRNAGYTLPPPAA